MGEVIPKHRSDQLVALPASTGLTAPLGVVVVDLPVEVAFVVVQVDPVGLEVVEVVVADLADDSSMAQEAQGEVLGTRGAGSGIEEVVVGIRMVATMTLHQMHQLDQEVGVGLEAVVEVEVEVEVDSRTVEEDSTTVEDLVIGVVVVVVVVVVVAVAVVAGEVGSVTVMVGMVDDMVVVMGQGTAETGVVAGVGMAETEVIVVIVVTVEVGTEVGTTTGGNDSTMEKGMVVVTLAGEGIRSLSPLSFRVRGKGPPTCYAYNNFIRRSARIRKWNAQRRPRQRQLRWVRGL